MKRVLFLASLMMLCFIMANGAWADPPSNDDCANADDAGTLVSGVTVQLSGTTVDASYDCDDSYNPEAWIKFTVSSCMYVTIDYCDYESELYTPPTKLYTECPCNGAINNSAMGYCSGSGTPSITWYNIQAGTYYYPVWDEMYTGPYTVNITGTDCPPAPENDDCSNAAEIGEVTDLSFSTLSATYDGSSSCITSGPNIWYVYTPTFTDTALIDLSESEYNTMLAVYDGVACSPLPTQLGCTTSSRFRFAVTAGQDYLIEIGGEDGDSGNGVMTIGVAPEVPANDECANADSVGNGILEPDIPIQFTGTTEAATMDCDNEGYPEVWVKFTSEVCMDVTIDFCSTDPIRSSSSYVSRYLYDSCPCGDNVYRTSSAYCDDENRSNTWESLPAGTYYYPIRYIDGYAAYVVNISGVACPEPPANDDCSAATDGGTLQSGSSVTFTGTNIGTTNDCETVGYPEAWITFTVPSCMNIAMDFCDINPAFNYFYDGLFNTCPCGEEPIVSDNSGSCSGDGNTILYWYNLEAGTYWYPIINISGSEGNYVINVTGTTCPDAPIPIEITAPDTVTGTTCGAIDNCYLIPGEDETYEVTIPTDGDWQFSLCNSETVWDSYLYLGTEICERDLAVNNDGCDEEDGHAAVTAYNLDAGIYYLTVDSRTSECGDYTLEITNLPGPCEDSYYTNGDANLNGGIIDYRYSDESFEAFAADDFTLTEEVTINSIMFIGGTNFYFNFANSGDYQILANDGTYGAPGTILFEGTDVSCTQTYTGEYYQGYIDVAAYQFDNLEITLSPGTYYLACRPICYDTYDPSYWLTTGSQSGSTAYYQNTDTPTWTIAEANADLAFCLFATTNGYVYVPGDVNMGNGQWPPTVIGGDVTYLVNYFRGITSPCLVSGFFCSADANGDCNVIGSDVTKMVSYFRGLASLSHCVNYEPTWHIPSECPTDVPTGWPNCGE